MSLYAEYIKEREGKNLIEDEHGFASFIFCGEDQRECYIVDIYVQPEHRKSGKASQYADEISRLAKLAGCTHLSGSVDPTNKYATESVMVLLAYGFRVVGYGNGLLWFKKELV